MDRIHPIRPPGLGNQTMAHEQTNEIMQSKAAATTTRDANDDGPEVGTAPAGATKLVLAGRNESQRSRPTPPHSAAPIPAHRLGNAVAGHHTLSCELHQQNKDRRETQDGGPAHASGSGTSAFGASSGASSNGTSRFRGLRNDPIYPQVKKKSLGEKCRDPGMTAGCKMHEGS